jgi:putative aldouronate transport system permease protein
MANRFSRMMNGSPIFRFINGTFILVATIAFIYPFLYVFSVSISNSIAVGTGKVWLWPINIDFTAYKRVLSNPKIMTAYWNTVKYAAVGSALVILFNILVAYPLSLKRFKAKALIVTYFAIPMFFGGGMIPRFLVVQSLGLIDTMWAFLLPAVGMWTIVMFRCNFQNIPESLHESAYMDGARDFRILFQIILPLSKPIIAAILLFSLVDIWNAYTGPMIYLSSANKFPIQVVLRGMIHSFGGDSQFLANLIETGTGDVFGMKQALKATAIIISTGPIIFIYPLLQKYFIKGVLIGSIKG